MHITANQLRRQFIDFFVKKHSHAEIPSASLLPENDPTVLFTTAGMHPIVPYLMGEPHPAGKRLVDAQKCLRTDDIDAVGDLTHLTFFEMLGNWSLGDYFKEKAIEMSFEFLVTPWDKGGLGIDPRDFRVTVFAGDDDAPRDEESIRVWQKVFLSVGIKAKIDEHIFLYGKSKNWWGPAGQTGPCGPDTEMFYDTGRQHDATFGNRCHPNCDCGKFVEIWNDVFMEFFKQADGTYKPLSQKNVDTGMGFERTLAVLQGVDTLFETELFEPVMNMIHTLASSSLSQGLIREEHIAAERIIADHLRAAVFIIGDPRGVTASNTDQGYVLRRLLRRAIRYGKKLGIEKSFIVHVAHVYLDIYGEAYPELKKNSQRIIDEFSQEEQKFKKTLITGLREFEKMVQRLKSQGNNEFIGEMSFHLYDTYGFPLEITQELAAEKGVTVDIVGFHSAYSEHQKKSRVGAEQKFAGGLADHSEASKRHHTATHLLHQALREVLGRHVEQRGSNITKERLRFDFSHPKKMTPEEIKKTEDIINVQIQRDLPVHFEILNVEEAKKRGAIGLFDDKYVQLGNKVKVYFMGDYSREVCGGPHVEHTGVLKSFTILKEEACSAGIRRIKAMVGGNE